MRLFAALEIPSGVKDSIWSLFEPVRQRYANLKWVSSGNLHLTLRFFGECHPDEVLKRIRMLQLERSLPVDFVLDRTGTFGRPPSVLWVSGSFSPGLYKMASKLARIPGEDGTPGPDRFIPHVTLARAKRGDTVPRPDVTFSIRERSATVSLIESRLTRKGPVYTNLESIMPYRGS